MKPIIKLDETQLDNITQDGSLPLYNIYKIEDGKKEMITQRRLDPNNLTLVAVSKSQFKCWSGWEIICEEVK